MIKIVTDSTSCVSEAYAKEHNISVVNLTTNLEGNVLQEGFESKQWDQFYESVKASKDFPKTSQPTPAEFEEVFRETLNENSNAKILVITISQSLSGTYNSARLAAENVKPENIFVLDSGQTAQSELLFLEEVVELVNQGKTAEEIFAMGEALRNRVCIQFVPQTMEYLKRGGRIDLLSATIASVLNIKPILSFKNGVLTNTKKCLGMQKAISEMVSEIPANFKKIYIVYIHEAGEWLNRTINKVNETLNTNIKKAFNVGPVVGSHIGMGTVGIAYITA